jgi:hypothetical protein
MLRRLNRKETDRVGNRVIACVELERLLAVRQQHCYSKFVKKGVKAILGTISENPHVLMVPLAIGAQERSRVYNFHHDYFLAQLAADIAPILSR